MTDSALVQAIDEWLIDQALGEPDMAGLFGQMCERVLAIGIPIGRATVTWTTLHPLVDAEQATWLRTTGITTTQIPHAQRGSQRWLDSPLRWLIVHRADIMRRRLAGPEQFLDFPFLEELSGDGFTDYVAMAVGIEHRMTRGEGEPTGIIITWTSDQPRGFTDGDIQSLQQLKQRYAVVARVAIQKRMTDNIATTYLGNQAGRRVLTGQIRLGDGETTDAVVWYSDLRGSTRLADTLPPEKFRALLNGYFQAMAGAAIEEGGEVLDFIGDAVLAIFPIGPDGDVEAAAKRACRAAGRAVSAMAELNRQRAESGEPALGYGLGLNRGEVMFGNIGVPQRLTFSVIGPTVNQVARIEGLTKSVGEPVLATREIAEHAPDAWTPAGTHALKGIAEEIELFAFRPRDAAAA